ncbi:DUF2750 domain-containing protein [Aureivirga marina]|uniref:DUF2750 domain-containing protein n=1 Tax=Aureivirga marina TaxID=1182451 RepID=UPI0018CA6966|nr:DUF2750 domain-containing protein [Aureivirga marina]
MTIHHKEIENVLKLSPFERYKYFIKKVADIEELWTIVDENNKFSIAEIDNKKLISFWSAKEYIKSNLEESWENEIPFKMNLDYFESKIIPLIEEKELLINVFSINGKSGFVVSLREFIRDLNEELELYY